MKVVDPHVHLWDTAAVSYPWLDRPTDAYSGDNRLLPKRYDAAALRADADAGGIEVLRTVAVEANPRHGLAEVRWLQKESEAPAHHGHPHGIIAYVDLTRPDAPELLNDLSRYGSVKGIRQILNAHSTPAFNYASVDYLSEPLWRANLRVLVSLGFSFDLQLYPGQAASAVKVIRENPGILFILNHAGMFVDRDAPLGWRGWKKALKDIAAQPNTAIKISGLAMFDHHWTLESFRPLVHETIDAFGTERAMFASNFPIDGLHASYSALWHAYSSSVRGLTTVELYSLFIGNAIHFYRLQTLSSGDT
jgi:predicted TIM-barrel fold metal-dependent hydrolase